MMLELPGYVRECVDALEAAGFAAWAVGGCVRDACLGLKPNDYDLCTDALPEQTKAVFSGYSLVLAGEKHGTVAVIVQGKPVEITTFRKEGAYLDNRHPEWVAFVPDIVEDLSRRDFTVNAMAWSPTRGLCDPFGGREDLTRGILRAVGDPEQRFREDALRILRGVRFAVRYDLTPEEKTWQAMQALTPLLDSLARERVFTELCGILLKAGAEQLLFFRSILVAAIPALAPMVGFQQHSPHHAYDLFTHTAYVTGNVPGELCLRWAALLHDLGKLDTFTLDETGRGHFYGHAKVGAQRAEEVLRGLKAPNALREQAVSLIAQHMTILEPDKKLLRRRVSQFGWEVVERLLCLQQADMGSKGVGKPADEDVFVRVRRLLEEIQEEHSCLQIKDLALKGNDLLALGLRGREIGVMLENLLEQVLAEALPNEKEALLAYVRENRRDDRN